MLGTDSGQTTLLPTTPTDAESHVIVEVHVVGHHVDVGVEDVGLTDNLFNDVPDASREDEQGDVVLVQLVEQFIEPIPGAEGWVRQSCTTSPPPPPSSQPGAQSRGPGPRSARPRGSAQASQTGTHT